MAYKIRVAGIARFRKENHKCLKENPLGPIFEYCPTCGEQLFEQAASEYHQCSDCGKSLVAFDLIKDFNFCHNCGARFEEEKFEGNK